MIDSDGKNMNQNVQIWGRKLNCEFEISQETSDGVAVIDINLQTDDGKEITTRKFIWVIK